MRRTLNLNRPNSIKNFIAELKQIERKVPRLCERFCKELAEKGILVAKQNTVQIDDLGNVSDCIAFYVQTTPKKDQCDALLIAQDLYQIVKTWDTGDGETKSAEVSALLMAEFGSGQYATTGNIQIFENSTSIVAGRGTFPNQTHAMQNVWFYHRNDRWYSSKGIQPTMPMFKAYTEMDAIIVQVGKEVFKELFR